MVKRTVRARNAKSALKAARRKYPGMTVTKVNMLKKGRKTKGVKTYQVVAHKKKRK